MAEFGLHVWDENGKLVLDNSKLSHRLWHGGLYTQSGNYYYSQPLNHEPTIVALGLGSRPGQWSHIVSGGQYLGFSLTLANTTYYREGPTIILVFARR